MLTKETITANVQGLTDEQAAALATLSENDEKASFSKRFADIHNEIDGKVFDATQVKRESNEKSSDYMSRALNLYAAQFADAKTAKSYEDTIATLKAENEKLSKAQAADEGERVKAVTAELNNTKNQYNALNAKYEQAQKEFDARLTGYKLQSAIEGAVSKFSFKDTNADMLDLAKNAAIAAVMAKNPSFSESGGILFHDNNGATLNNPNNMLNPFTAEELLKAEFDKYGILKEPRQKSGTGSQQDVEQNNATGYRTQTQALDFIAKELQSKGMVRGSDEYQKAVNEFWTKNRISTMPIN